MSLIEAILLLLVGARIAGEMAERYGQPAMVGEITAGILLGPSVLNAVRITPELSAIAELGVLLLVFLAGLEMDLKQMAASFRRRGAWVSVLSFAIPFAAGMGVGAAFGYDLTRVVFLGLCIAITALPVSVRILMDLNLLHSDVGRRILSAAVANDLAALLVLGIIMDVGNGAAGAGDFALSLGWAMLKVVLLMSAVAGVARLVQYSTGRIPRSRLWLDWLLARLKGKEALFALVLLFVMAFASLSEALGLHFVVGAFFGAMLLSNEILGPENFAKVRSVASTVTMGFLGPVFFAAIGVQFQAAALANWPLVTAVLAAAFASKILGGYWGGRLAGIGKRESWMIGAGLNGRGIMELIIANIALANGLIGPDLFTILVLMGTVTTFVTPILLRRIQAAGPPEAPGAGGAPR